MFIRNLPFMLAGILSFGAGFAQTKVEPYDGVAASPFHGFGLMDTFSVEDFEVGKVNVRGVTIVPSDGMEAGTLEINANGVYREFHC